MSDIRVFIVDDEDIVRDGLKQYVPWYDYGMEVVGSAANGKEAYDYLCHHEVDLIFQIYTCHIWMVLKWLRSCRQMERILL